MPKSPLMEQDTHLSSNTHPGGLGALLTRALLPPTAVPGLLSGSRMRHPLAPAAATLPTLPAAGSQRGPDTAAMSCATSSGISPLASFLPEPAWPGAVPGSQGSGTAGSLCRGQSRRHSPSQPQHPHRTAGCRQNREGSALLGKGEQSCSRLWGLSQSQPPAPQTHQAPGAAGWAWVAPQAPRAGHPAATSPGPHAAHSAVPRTALQGPGQREQRCDSSSRGVGQPAETRHNRATRPAHGTAEHSTITALTEGRESRERWGPADTGLVKGSSRAKDTWLLSKTLRLH